MNQPTRRKSSLSGANPVAPAPEPPPAAASTVEVSPAKTAGPAVSTIGTRQGASSQPKQRKYPPKVSFYQDPEDTARLRAAYRHTLANTADRSLSDFIQRVVMAEVERLEGQYNSGKPFPSVGAGELPQGRPVGE